jgi:hypothetical protein
MSEIRFEDIRPGLTDKIAAQGGTPEFSLEASQGTITEEHDIRSNPDSRRVFVALASSLTADGLRIEDLGLGSDRSDQD